MRDLPTHQCCYNGIVVKQILNLSFHILYEHFEVPILVVATKVSSSKIQ
jgi:hypothetical protein